MDNSRQNKETPLQMKRRMIETRRQSNILTPQQPVKNCQKQPTINIHPHLIQELPTFNYNQNSSKMTSQLERSSIKSKQKQSGRLKLKDYLHLNNLQKKTQERRSLSSSKSITKQSIEPLKTKKKIGGEIVQREISEAQRIRNYQNILKKQIEVMVVQEAAKLKQIEQYLELEFKPTDKAKETFYYLFQIYNSLMQIEGINKKIGEKILHYEQPKQVFKQQQGRLIPFWERASPTPSKNKQTIDQIIRQSQRQT